MAADKNRTMTQLNDLKECCICLKTFTDPRMLPCIHTFCFHCLQDLVEKSNKKPGDQIQCPVCKKDFTLSGDGIQGLQKNFFMASLIEVRNALNQSKMNLSCDICKANNDSNVAQISEATMRCLDCQENLCEGCCKMHKSFKMSKSHEIIKIGIELGEEDVVKTLKVTNCDIHRGKALDFYCADCKKVFCVSCFDESYKTHDCKNINTVEEEFRENIKTNANIISTLAEELQDKKNKMESKEEFLRKIATRESEILQRSKELKEMIDEHTKSLLSSLDEIKKRHLKEIHVEEDELDMRYTILESFSRYCDELRTKGSASDVCRSKDELLRRADELKEEHETYIMRPRVSFDVTFQATEFENLLMTTNGNIIGRVNGFKYTETSSDTTKNDCEQTEDIFSSDQTFIICNQLRTFALDGLKVTNCIFRADHVEICFLLEENCVYNKDELIQQLSKHLQIESGLIKLAKLRAKPIYRDTSLRPGETATIQSRGECKIGAFVEVEGKGKHALTSGHGKTPDNILLYPNGERLGVVNVSLQPPLQPTSGKNWYNYSDVALARLERQDGYIAGVLDDSHGPLGLMEQPVEASNNLKVRRFTRDGRRGKVDSTAYIIFDPDYGICHRLISVIGEDGGPMHEAGESGFLIATDDPVDGRVEAVGMLVRLEEMLEDNEEERMRVTSLAVPLPSNFDALRSDPYCTGATIRFLN